MNATEEPQTACRAPSNATGANHSGTIPSRIHELCRCMRFTNAGSIRPSGNGECGNARLFGPSKAIRAFWDGFRFTERRRPEPDRVF
jgi:hypothetical protein